MPERIPSKLVPDELNPKLDITVITNVEGLGIAQSYLATTFVFAYDTETNMTDDFTKRKIRTIQFGDKNKQFVIDLLPFAKRAGITLEEAMAVPYKPHACLQAVIDLLKPVMQSVQWLKIGHNFQFDYEVTKYCLGIRTRNMHCTLLAEKTFHCGRVPFNIKGFWALDDLVLRYMNLIISKDEQKTFNLTEPLTHNQVVYCGLDCRLPYGIRIKQLQLLEQADLLLTLRIENDCIAAFGDMFLNGMPINKKKWLRTVFKYKKAHKRNIAKLDEFFIPIVGHKDDHAFSSESLNALEQIWRDEDDKPTRAFYRKQFMAARKIATERRNKYKTYAGMAAINYASPVALYNVLKALPRFVEANELNKTNRRLPKFTDTGDRTLKNFAEHGSWDLEKVQEVDPNYERVGMIDALRLYRETEKLLNSYGANWLRKHVNKTTGRVHGKLNQIGADTGRTSCSNPNMQQIPRGSEWRSCFETSNGNKVITMDLSGAELVILAELSQDPVFVHAFKNGWDVHSVVAEIVFKQEWKDGTIHEPVILNGKSIPRCAYYYDSGGGNHKKCSCPSHKRTRTKAKPCGLGMAYGMEAGKLADQIGVTFSEAENIIKIFRESFPVLIAYLAESGNRAKELCESRSLSRRRRIFHKPLYRDAVSKAKKKLEEKGIDNKAPSSRDISWSFKAMFSAIEREGKNNPLQSSNADISKIAMGDSITEQGVLMMGQVLEDKFNAMLVLFVHDEFVVEVASELAQECAEYMETAAISGAAELIKSVPMGVEYDIDNFWNK